MEPLDRLKARLLPIVEPDNVLEELITSAGEDILLFTNRTEVPDLLKGMQVDLAMIRYNQRGIEGESSHSEGGVSRSISSLPPEKVALLTDMRLATTAK